MTKHSDSTKQTNIVVVDGSNIATEGRSSPSLAQLNEAVTAFLEENAGATATVVVDATFGHRIAKKEVKEFDEAVANNELVAPPAGAIGRGDAFVLSIANKVGARILSNDSFQEFHGDYPWLFDEGRLIGGKPVPNIGWVFVPRVPVQGARSRKAQRDAKVQPAKAASRRSASAAASQPVPVPTSPPPTKAKAKAAEPVPRRTQSAPRPAPSGAAPVNDTLPFLEFVEKHPVGTSVNAEVESYSSHGAYAAVGDVRAYIPLALMADPPPRSARSVISIGEALTLVVAAFSPARRSIDLAFPHMVTPDGIALVSEAATPSTAEPAPEPQPARRSRKKSAAAAEPPAGDTAAAPARRGRRAAASAQGTEVDKAAVTAETATAATRPTRKRSSAAKKAASIPPAPVKEAAAKKAPAKKTAAKKTAAKRTAAKPSTAKKPAAKKQAAAKVAATKQGATKKTGARSSGTSTRKAAASSSAGEGTD